MLKYFIVGIAIFSSSILSAQQLSGNQLLDNAINYHDPQGKWSTFKGKFVIEMTTPEKTPRLTLLELNFPKDYFKATVRKKPNTVEYILDKDSCNLKLNYSEVIADHYRDSLQINCGRAKMLKNYYTYLYGLPMKLKDAGTNVDPTVIKKKFKGKDYLRLKVTYDANVGKDIWYFYFDPNTYAMEVYQFYHDESKNDGEYILLSDILEVNGINMPKTRAWYYNKDNTYLGTDVLLKGGPLK
ncbi:DUF6503 family protein [Maribacter sp. CXY002]|uniref:DUF6503 family protein n=1 Tax=Maribacter luteocoastalis TaxID=3407671 RepID=UPI003B67F390